MTDRWAGRGRCTRCRCLRYCHRWLVRRRGAGPTSREREEWLCADCAAAVRAAAGVTAALYAPRPGDESPF